MAVGVQTQRWDRTSRRRVPRYRVQAPMDVTVLRSGIPDTLPGRSVNLCERGIAVVLAGELVTGEAVGVEVRLPLAYNPLRTRALVRYQDKLRCGLEFVGLSAEQRAAILDWAAQSKAEAEQAVSEIFAPQTQGGHDGTTRSSGPSNPGRPKPKQRGGRWGWPVLLVVAAVLVAVFWWRWNRGWEEIESGLPGQDSAVGVPRVQVPAEVMQKLLVHKVDPDYPDAARGAKVQGVVVLDVVVGRDGSVVEMRPVNGPDVLVRSAMDALRWWKFEPYRVNGKPAVVETRMAVEFKP